MSARASSITADRKSLRDIFEPLLRPRRFVDGLKSSRAETQRNADDAISQFVDGFESSRRADETEGNAVDAAMWRFMSRLELLDSESLLGLNGMLLEDYVWLEGWWWKVEARCSGVNDDDRLILWSKGGKLKKRRPENSEASSCGTVAVLWMEESGN
jgi:hypothetical protein